MKRPVSYQQGELDALCGLYAIINAMIAVRPEMTEREITRVFRRLTRVAAQERQSFDDLVRDGMHGSLLRRLLSGALDDTSRRHSMTFDLIRPAAGDLVSVKAIVCFLQAKLDRRSAAILLIRDTSAHWTVATKVTAKEIHLFDSGDRTRIRIARCTIRKGVKTHVRLHAKEFIVIRRQNPGW